MTTLIHRALGPDKKAAEMSDSDDAAHTRRASQEQAGQASESAKSSEPAGKPQSPADQKRQRAWVPGAAALLTTLIGLSDILNILRPDLVSRFHRFNTDDPRVAGHRHPQRGTWSSG